MSNKILERKVIFPPSEINSHGLKMVEEHREKGTWYKFDLPDGVQILPFDENGKIIAVRQERNGVFYLGLIGETMNSAEQEKFRNAVATEQSAEIARIACQVAQRGLIEEAGYEAKKMDFLSSILVNSGKGIPAHCFVKAYGCHKTKEPEKGIKVELWSPEEFFLALRAQLLSWPASPKAGGNSLLAVALGLPLGLPNNPKSDKI